MRVDGRQNYEIRRLQITRQFIKHAEGSVLIQLGDTKVICTASVEEKVPPFLLNSSKGWITAEYSMLPRSTHQRMIRERSRGRQGGRTLEIQRLVGRSLRAVVDMKLMGERTIWVDCDVIQADGGTRTAAITGAFIAVWDSLKYLQQTGLLSVFPVKDYVAATSVGIVDGQQLLDLCYLEDSSAEVDMNVVMTGRGLLVEIQGTAESVPFNRNKLNQLVDLAEKGIRELIAYQHALLEVV